MPDLIRQSDEAGSNEVLPPEIKIIQNTTSNKLAGSKAGQFMNTITNEVFDNFEFVFVDRTATRTYWGRETIEDEPPTCWSPNVNSYESADGKDCRKCQYRLDNAASVTATIRRTRCCTHFTIMGMKQPDWEPFMMRINGISTGEFMRLMSFFKYNPAIRDKETGKPMYHVVKIPVSTVETKSPAGTAFSLKFGQIQPLDNETVELSLSLSAEMLGQSNTLEIGEGDNQETETNKDVQSLYEENKNTALPAAAPPRVRVINPEPPKQSDKIFIGYLEDGREIYTGDLVPAGARILKEKPAAPPATEPKRETQTIGLKDVGKAEIIIKPTPATAASQTKTASAGKAAPIDIGSL
ncbi:MAG: hypothetical protein ABSF21_00250 [Dehalococcoidia bacterium]